MKSQVRGAANAMPKQIPKLSKTQPSTFPNPPKSRSGASLGAKMHPKGASHQPRDAHERSRRAQEPPKKCPRDPKSPPRATKSRPSAVQEHSKRSPDPSKTEPSQPQDEFAVQSLWEPQFDRPRERFCMLYILCAMHVICTKHRKNLGFS